jgi:hypothetical protein
MNRIEKEKEVLATILLMPFFYEKLPLNFSPACFETFEYALIFERVDLDYIQKGKCVNCLELVDRYPELLSDIISISRSMKPLFENFRSKAEELLPPKLSFEEYADEIMRKMGLRDQEKSVDGLNSGT